MWRCTSRPIAHEERLNKSVVIILALLIPLIIFPVSGAYAFGDDIFTLQETAPEISWLTLPDRWEALSGVTLGISGNELVIFFPRDETGTPDIYEYDWPPRIVFRTGKMPGLSLVTDIESTYYLEFSALLDRVTLVPYMDEWEVTLYMQRPLRRTITQSINYCRIHIQFLGTWLDLADQGDGWRLWEINRFLLDGVQHAYVAQISSLDPRTEARVVTSSQFGKKSATVEEHVTLNRAIGGINGGYFFNNRSLGMLINNGEMASLPMLSRPVFALSKDGEPYIGNIRINCLATIGGRDPVTIDAIDDYPGNSAVLLTPDHPARVRGNFSGLKVVLKDNVVEYVTDGQVKELSGRSFIWDMYGTSPILKYCQTGEAVIFDHEISGPPFQPQWLLQAGPMLVQDGRPSDFREGSFQNNITSGRAPRTAVALTVHGELLMFMGEGRMDIHSLGFTLQEAAEMLIESGAHTAINLDGGASSAMFLNGRYKGFAPTGFRKSIPNAIVFGDFSRQPESAGFL